MPHCQPPHRFTSDNQPKIKNHGHKGPYFLPLLKKYLNKEINCVDPSDPNGSKVRMKVRDAVLWRLLLNATEGETKAIIEILDRIDGKVPLPVSQELEIPNADQHFKQIADAIIQSDTDTGGVLQRPASVRDKSGR